MTPLITTNMISRTMPWKSLLPIFSFMLEAIALSEIRITPAEEPIIASPIPTAFRREVLTSICGYQDLNVLSQFTCDQGSACFAEPTYNVAGYCCRIGDFANCKGPTQCIEQASLTASCDGECTSNERVTKCSDLAAPYCFTRYYIQGGSRTPSELGCTSTQGYLAYLYTTYTMFGSVDIDYTTPTAALTTPYPTASSTYDASESGASSDGSDSVGYLSSGSATSTSSGSGSDSDSGSSNTDSSDRKSSSGGSSVPAGPIAGGVVGGVVALAAAAIIVTWLILRHRRQPKPEKTYLINHGPISDNSGNNGGQAGLAEPKPSHPLLSPVSVHNEPQEIGINDKVHELYEQRELRPQLP